MKRLTSRSPLSLRPTLRNSLLLSAGFLTACSTTGSKPEPKAMAHSPSLTPTFINDPLEPVNRGVWKFNEGLLLGVVQPTARAYRAVVPTPVRGSIKDFTRNITYPGRLANNLLQGRWKGAGDESLRFLCNTTVGVAGFHDIASDWNMPKSDANFSQTFGTWGWKPQAFLMLPLAGPSDDRNLTGRVADTAAEPWTYADSPYNYAPYVSSFNELSERTEDAARLVKTDKDSYAIAKYAWTYVTKDGEPDWRLRGPVDVSTLQTLGAVNVKTEDPEFANHGKEMAVRIPSTGHKLKFNYWLQPGPAPLVYINPGLSSHRLSLSALSLAEDLYRLGYSVVTTTSVFHPEFMENASTAALPAYPPIDSNDLLVSLTEMDRALEKKYPGRFEKRALVGCSMGAFLTLRLAACENQAAPGMIHFDRYVAINPPVNLRYGVMRLDSFYNAPLAWPATERQARIDNVLHKGAAITRKPLKLDSPPPFDENESKYIVGLSFRLTLRDILFSTQSRNNMGVIQTPISKWNRESVYEEMMSYRISDYFTKFAVPYYQQRGIGVAALQREGNLRIHEKNLRRQDKVRVITNANDFLLAPGDLSWLSSTVGTSHIKVFPNGGHMGTLSTAPVRSAIEQSLTGLK